MSTDEWIGIKLGKESALVSVKLSIPALRYAADVIPRCDPLSWPDQLEGELAIIEAPKMDGTQILQAMEPIVSVDKKYSPRCHYDKTPGCDTLRQTPGG